MLTTPSLIAALALWQLPLHIHCVSANSFRLQDSYVGKDFLSAFKWETFDDPTHGRVNYVDKPTALQNGLTGVKGNQFFMKADSTNKVAQGGRGRSSNRIVSQKSYLDSVIVLDVVHMPEGCATWPAFWTVTAGQWPKGGEIDIIEGVNSNTQNLVSLHTTGNCTMTQPVQQSGSVVSTDCNAYANGNQGCGTDITKSNSYGSGFNGAGGGWYALKRTQADGVYAYFWSRNDPSVPQEIRSGSGSIVTENWGVPDVRFPSSNTCDFASHFDAHQIVFDLTFCGDWAGNVYKQSGCGADMNACVAYVDNNPSAFANAFWTINALQVYTPAANFAPDGSSSPTQGRPASPSPSPSAPLIPIFNNVFGV